jgi:hypothetical protein
MTRTAGGCRVRTRTRSVADPEVAGLRDEIADLGGCGVSVNRCHTADRAEFRRRLLSGNVFQDSFNVRTGDVGDHAQPAAAVRTDRQIDCEYSAQSLHPGHRRSRCVMVGLTISTQCRHRRVDLSINRLAREIAVPPGRISAIVNGPAKRKQQLLNSSEMWNDVNGWWLAWPHAHMCGG